jgi:2,4-dienoyl-CoA reductase-like NADH-dependent reductase (Old Yellow Enzyme family)
MSHLFDPFQLRGVTLRNRVGVSPMCTYSASDGRPDDWHRVHLGSRAAGGASLVITEATAVEPRGRISPADCGLWDDSFIAAWAPITRFLLTQGAVPAIQLAHAGRKAGTRPPFAGRGPLRADEGSWEPVGPSAVPFTDGYRVPRALEEAELGELADRFAAAAVRAHAAGFQAVEVHAAHGYLLHEFLSPLSNRRDDAWGGSLENRMRFPLDVVRRVRAAWPDELPLLVRISATDWMRDGWDVEQSVTFCREMRRLGVDLVDCSSGGLVPQQQVPLGPGYQVPFAERIRREAEVPTAAVGMITEPVMAEEIVHDGRADLVFLGREFLRDPYWPIRAAGELGHPVPWPPQYAWAVG